MENILIIAPIVGLIALAYAFLKANFIAKQDVGNDRMREISGHIHDGAMAFLKREYKVLIIFVVVFIFLLIQNRKVIFGKEKNPTTFMH